MPGGVAGDRSDYLTAPMPIFRVWNKRSGCDRVQLRQGVVRQCQFGRGQVFAQVDRR